MKRLILLIIGLFFALAPCWATNHYVWCGSAHNGDGTTLGSAGTIGGVGAFTDLPSSLTRGDTYYVAGSNSCTYGDLSFSNGALHTFNDAESSTTVISVLKVTSAQSGVTGYTSAMATNPAKWLIASKTDPQTNSLPPWAICNGYYTIDGEIGSTDPIAGAGGQGFVLQSSAAMNHGYIYGSTNTCGGGAKTFSNITIHHVQLATNNSDNFYPVPVTSCSWAGGTADIVTSTPGWSQGWVAGDYVSGSTSGRLAAFGPSGSAPQIATVISPASEFTVPVASSPCAALSGGYVELDIGGSKGVGANGFYFIFPGNVFNNLDIQYNYIQPSAFDGVTYFNSGAQGTGSVFEHNYFVSGTGWPQAHGQAFQIGAVSGMTVAFNAFAEAFGTAIVFNSNGSGTTDNTSTNIYFYGNLIYSTGSKYVTSGLSALVEAYDPTCTEPGNAPINGLLAYNNTIANMNSANGFWAGNVGFQDGAGACSSAWTIEDNLYWNSVQVAMASAAITHDYNTLLNTPWSVGSTSSAHDYQTPSGSTDPFVSDATANFNLSSETVDPHLNDGVTLSSPYDVDFAGISRVAGSWTRGAYQYTFFPVDSLSSSTCSLNGQSVGLLSCSVTLTNTGTGASTITSLTVSPGNYGFSTTPASNCGGGLAASASCVISFYLTKTGSNPAGTFTVTDDGGSPTVSLTGTGGYVLSQGGVRTIGGNASH